MALREFLSAFGPVEPPPPVFCRRDSAGFSLARIAHDFRWLKYIGGSAESIEPARRNSSVQRGATTVRRTTFAGTRFSMSRTRWRARSCRQLELEFALGGASRLRGDWTSCADDDGAAAPAVTICRSRTAAENFSIGWGIYNIPLNLSVLARCRTSSRWTRSIIPPRAR